MRTETDVAQERDMLCDVKEVMNFRGPYNVPNFFTSWKTVSFSMTVFHGLILIIKVNEMHSFSNLFDKVPYMFRTSPLSIIRSISTLYTRNSYLSC